MNNYLISFTHFGWKNFNGSERRVFRREQLTILVQSDGSYDDAVSAIKNIFIDVMDIQNLTLKVLTVQQL